MQPDSTDNPEDNRPVRIGARVVVELLRLKADTPASGKLALAEARNKNALAVLRDRLHALQQSLVFPAGVTSVADALVHACQDLQIPLPVAQPDWGSIRLLDQLFDQLLAHQSLDEQAREWMQFLRLPVIRYAILDYSFFFTPQNLLRRFLNQLHLALLSSSEKSRQVLRDSLQPFLQRLHSEFKQDVGPCNRICIEAQTWFASHDDKVEQIEEQLRTREISLRKTQVAEPRVVRELNRIAGGKMLVREMTGFLHGEWRRSLLQISMQEGEEGATWKRQIRITESLVEMALGCEDEQGRAKHRSFFPVLMKNIKTLLVSVNQDSAALDAALDPLELVLVALLNGAHLEQIETPLLHDAQAAVTAVTVKQVGSKALASIQLLQPGDWVRILTADGHHDVFRITLKADADQPWVLVSQSGRTITKKTAFQLAQGLEGGVLDILGKGHWWDDQLDRQLNELHQQWQDELARRPPAPPKPVAKPEKVQSAPAQASSGPAEESLALVSLEQQASTHHGSEPAIVSRTDQILANSQLTLDEPAQPESAQSGIDTLADFLSPHPVSDEERATALEAIDQIQVGGWITQQTSSGEERCKLAVKIRGRDKLIFVNRLGVKVLEIDRQPLAELVACGLVIIVDTGKKFDNTLERVVRSIQEDRKPS